MRGHWLWYGAAVVGAISLMMAGFAVMRHAVGSGGEEEATARVLGATIDPGRDLFTVLPSATRSARASPPTASPTPAVVAAEATSIPARPPAAPAPIVSEPAPAPPPADWPDYEFAARVLSLVNGERAARGVGPLEVHPALAVAAQAYARLLVTTGSFGHEGPDGSTIPSRIYEAGFPGPAYLGEVLWWAVGWLGAEQVVSAWLASDAHGPEILKPAFRLAGIGCHFRQAERLHGRCVLDLAGG